FVRGNQQNPDVVYQLREEIAVTVTLQVRVTVWCALIAALDIKGIRGELYECFARSDGDNQKLRLWDSEILGVLRRLSATNHDESLKNLVERAKGADQPLDAIIQWVRALQIAEPEQIPSDRTPEEADANINLAHSVGQPAAIEPNSTSPEFDR